MAGGLGWFPTQPLPGPQHQQAERDEQEEVPQGLPASLEGTWETNP